MGFGSSTSEDVEEIEDSESEESDIGDLKENEKGFDEDVDGDGEGADGGDDPEGHRTNLENIRRQKNLRKQKQSAAGEQGPPKKRSNPWNVVDNEMVREYLGAQAKKVVNGQTDHQLKMTALAHENIDALKIIKKTTNLVGKQ